MCTRFHKIQRYISLFILKGRGFSKSYLHLSQLKAVISHVTVDMPKQNLEMNPTTSHIQNDGRVIDEATDVYYEAEDKQVTAV